MANPVKALDLFELEKAIEVLEQMQKKLADLSDSEVESAKKLKARIDQLSSSHQDYRDTVEVSAAQAEEISKRYKKYNESLGEGAVKIAALKEAQRKINQVNKLESKILSAKEGSYDRLSAQYSLNKIRLNQLSAEERKSTKTGQDLEKQTREIYEEMKRLQEATGKHVLSVGDYEKGTRGLVSQLKEAPGALGGMADGVDGVNTRIKALMANPIVLFLSAIVAALSALVGGFMKTERGAKTWNAIMATGEAVLGSFSQAADGLVDFLDRDFSEVIKDVAGFLKDRLVTALNAPIALTQALGRALSALANGDMAELKEAGKDAAFSLQQLTTGMTRADWDGVADAIKNQSSAIYENGRALFDLDERRRQLILTNAAVISQIERITTKEALLQVAIGDTTSSLEERAAATLEASRAAEDRAALELSMARENLNIIQQEIAIRRRMKQDVLGLREEETSAIREVMGAERELALARAENDRERRQLAQDQLEIELDFLIDLADNQKAINERRLSDEKLTEEERRALLVDTVALSKKSFEEQVALLQSATSEQINANELLNESDAKRQLEQAKQLGLSEALMKRLLEVIRDRRIAVQDLTEAQDELNKEIKETNQIDVLGNAISDQAIEATKAQAKKLRDTLKPDGGNDKLSLKEMLGLGDDQMEAVSDSIDWAIGQLEGLVEARREAADQAVEDSRRQIDSAEEALNREIANRNAGFAANVIDAERNLQLAKEAEQRALKEREAAQRQEILLNSASEASSLSLAAAKIWAAFSGTIAGTLLAGGIIAGMFGSFVAAKAKALKLSKREFREGGLEILGGGRHGSGNDTFLGFNDADGRPAFGERDEAHMVLTPSVTRKYRSVLPSLYDALRTGRLRDFASDLVGGIPGSSTIMDMSETNGELRKIRKQGSSRVYTDSRGRTVKDSGMNKKRYR